MARSSSSIVGLALVCLAGLTVPSTAKANPDVEACKGKREGEACQRMKLVKPPGGGELERKTIPGACRADECCDLDYSKGSPPETTCHACLACKDGPSDDAPPPARADDPEAPANGEPPRTSEAGPPPTAPTEQRGCSIGSRGGSPRGGWLAGLLVLAALRRRAQPQ